MIKDQNKSKVIVKDENCEYYKLKIYIFYLNILNKNLLILNLKTYFKYLLII